MPKGIKGSGEARFAGGAVTPKGQRLPNREEKRRMNKVLREQRKAQGLDVRNGKKRATNKGLNSGDPDQLNPRQRIYVENYLANGFNSIEAGYSVAPKEMLTIKGYRSGCAYPAGEPRVVAAIRKRMVEMLEPLGASQERVMIELVRVAFSDVRDVITVEDGKVCLRDLDGLDKGVAAAIQSVEAKTYRGESSLKVVMHEKLRGLELMGKAFGMYDKGPKGGPQVQVNINQQPAEDPKERAAQIFMALMQAKGLQVGSLGPASAAEEEEPIVVESRQ
jgi:phage terminase small subunit